MTDRAEILAIAERIENDREYCDDDRWAIARAVRELVEENERLRSALVDGLELFDNYGFADESPCARDREIVALMREQAGTKEAGSHFSEVSEANEKLRTELAALKKEIEDAPVLYGKRQGVDGYGFAFTAIRGPADTESCRAVRITKLEGK